MLYFKHFIKKGVKFFTFYLVDIKEWLTFAI